MSKLKCWKRNEDFFDKGEYPKHDGIMLLRVKTSEPPSLNKKWVWEYYRERNDKFKERKLFKTKPKALSFAQKYMKDHDTC